MLQSRTSAVWSDRLTGSLRLLVVVLAVFLPVSLGAQANTTQLAGRLTATDGSPVAGVEVTVAGSLLAARSDSAGRFLVEAVPAGALRIQVRALGFAPLDTLLVFRGSDSVTLTMARSVQQLAPVVTEAVLPYGKPMRYQHTSKFDDFYERRARGRGAFFDRERIENFGGNTVMQVMSSVPGVFVNWRDEAEEPYIRVPRCEGTSIWGSPRGRSKEDRVEAQYRWLAVYVDGQRIGRGITILSQLKLGDVETIEVYRGSSEVPQIAMGDACAAVFVTTRYTTGSVLPRK